MYIEKQCAGLFIPNGVRRGNVIGSTISLVDDRPVQLPGTGNRVGQVQADIGAAVWTSVEVVLCQRFFEIVGGANRRWENQIFAIVDQRRIRRGVIAGPVSS